MDDFVMSNLQESRNEWSSRLISILTGLMREGIHSIFDEAWKICAENDETNKYLMTFQNLLCGVPKWNAITVEREKNRIIEKSGCHYLEDLISCVHIIQLKVLTCIRVGNKQKKIDISIPKLDLFLHKAYIHIARAVYTNVYLFEKGIPNLQRQKYNRELENIVQQSILTTIRESIPTEAIIRAYMDESIEHEEEVFIENIEEPIEEEENPSKGGGESKDGGTNMPSMVPSIENLDDKEVTTTLSFNDMDSVLDSDDTILSQNAPKNIARLEEICNARALQRKQEEEEEDEEDEKIDKICIHHEPMELSEFDTIPDEDISLLDFEELS